MAITLEQVKEHLRYDPLSGVFVRLTSNHYRWPIDSIAGVVDKSTGYVKIGLLGERFFAHRLAWLYMTGVWPKEQIDHRNGARSDNRFVNLRECSIAQNRQNAGKRLDNTLGLVGIEKRYDKFIARFRGKYLGIFESAEVAHAAYLAAKAKQHEFQPVPRYEGSASRP